MLDDRKKKKGILKPSKPATSTERLNASIQHGFQTLKRDLFGGSTAKETNQTQLNTNANAANPLFWRVSLPSAVVPTLQAAHNAANSSTKELSVRPLRAVRFTMSALKVVYPLASDAPPSQESTNRDKVNADHRTLLRELKNKSWTGEELTKLYEECCRVREEVSLEPIQRALNPNHGSKRSSTSVAPKTIDLTGLHLSTGAAEALSDVLSINFGLKKLVLENCALEDEGLKAILHALLVSGSLPTLNLANNRKIKSKGWRFVAVFIRKAPALRFIDLSENNFDRKTVEWLTQAITSTSTKSSMRDAGQDFDTQNTPKETLLNQAGGLGLQLSSVQDTDALDNQHLAQTAPLLKDDFQDGSQPAIALLTSFRLENCNIRNQALEILAHAIRRSNVKHISLRRNRITALGAVALAVMMRDYPVATDPDAPPHLIASTSKSATASPEASPISDSHSMLPNGDHFYPPPLPPKTDTLIASVHDDEDEGTYDRFDLGSTARARLKLLREISILPKLGHLVTLDVKANDIRNGATYIAQVLKRNRTLKVLNLSENKIDPFGLVAVAEALKFNTTLETLDMSKNPCCGPKVDGVFALRSAFHENHSLMRVFLNATDITSEGAICLAEYLPEIKTLIHLDLTENYEIDIAGVMALAVSVKMNKTLRCLDLNIPPNDPDFSRLSQEILQSCIRNTEVAQELSSSKGIKQPVSAPILKSAVARNLEASQEQQSEGMRRTSSSVQRIVSAAKQNHDLLKEILGSWTTGTPMPEILSDVLDAARVAQLQLAEALSAPDGEQVELNESLIEICSQASNRISSLHAPVHTNLLSPSPTSKTSPLEPHSPTFSITDSDEDSSEDESTVKPTSTLVLDKLETSNVADPDSPRSPVESQSRNWVAEESEVFRKKMYLDSLDDQEVDNDEISGDQLRKELLETEVEKRPSSSPVLDINVPLQEDAQEKAVAVTD